MEILEITTRISLELVTRIALDDPDGPRVIAIEASAPTIERIAESASESAKP